MKNIHSRNISVCKCGSIPKEGDTFYYKSKYSDDVIKGIIGRLSPPNNFFSTTGALYLCLDVEIKPLQIVRDEKLEDLGIF